MMWRVNLLSTIHITKALSLLQSAIMKKIARLCQHHGCGMINLESAEQFSNHIHDRSANLWI
jgi:hypothetical protein